MANPDLAIGALAKPNHDRAKSALRRLQAKADKAVYLAVHARDQRLCQVCGIFCGQSIHLHHKIYRSQGGPTTLDNLVSVCRRCHEGIHARRVMVSDAAFVWDEERR